MIDLRRQLHIDDVSPLYAAGAAALAVVILFVRFGGPRRSKPAMTLSVRWGREKLRVPLPAPDAKLGELRRILAEQTSLPPNSFKLVHAGAVMKDDNAPLSAYGLRSGSKIAIIDGGAKAHTASAPPQEVDESKSKAKPETEEATIAIIRDELSRVQEKLAPALDVFLVTIAPQNEQPSLSSTTTAPNPQSANGSAASPTHSQNPASESTSATNTAVPKIPPGSVLPDIEMEHRRLGEELLQSLLRLDVLSLDGSWASARTERKSAVKTIQALLDRLDGGWRQRKERLASQQQVQ